MSIQIRPLGCRENLVAFELRWRVRAERGGAPDIRAAWVLWDPQGSPRHPYPEIPIERPMTGYELMRAQEEAWREHAALTRRLFGASPLSGPAAPGRSIRGLLAFYVEILGEHGRWTLVHRAGPRWYFTPQQLREGLPRPLFPAAGILPEGPLPR